MPVKSVDDVKSLMRQFVDEFQSNGDEAVADELLADMESTRRVERLG